MSHIAAITRLQSLPAIFRGADLTVRFGWTSKTASHYLYLWKRRKLVEGFGGHSDVFANLLMTRAPAGTSTSKPDWDAALRAAMPSAVVTGVEALRRAGWTTQVPARPGVAVDAAQPVYKTPHFDVSPRPAAWFPRIRAGCTKEAGTLPLLKPAWALAGLLHGANWGDHGVWPDDIDWSVPTPQDGEEWQAACAALGMPPQDLFSLGAPPRAHHAPAGTAPVPDQSTSHQTTSHQTISHQTISQKAPRIARASRTARRASRQPDSNQE